MNGLSDVDATRRVLAQVFVVVAILAWLFTAVLYLAEVAA